jgi:hypothetical protein
MSIIAPSNLQPEFSCHDARENIVFSWKSNIISQYAYQLRFYNNSTDALLFDTTQVVSANTTYTLLANSIANALEVKYKVTVWSDASTSVDSEFILIKTAAKPTVSIGTVPTTTESFEFVATVVLASGVTIQKFRYTLYDNFNNLVYDSGYILDYVPKHEIVGLLPNFPYKVQVEIVDSNDQSGISTLVPFQITQTASSVSLFTLTAIDNAATVKIDFNPINQTLGTVSGTYDFTDGKFGQGLNLSSGGFVQFEKTIATTFCVTVYRKLPTDFIGDIVSFGDNELVVFYTGQRFGYMFGDFITVGALRTLPNPSDFLKIIVKYGKVLVQTLTYTEVI